MDEDVLKRIFTYNIYWLMGKKTFGDVVINKLEDYSDKFANKFLSGKSYRNFLRRKGVPDYIKGSLIDNVDSLELKEMLRSKFFTPDVQEQFLSLSKYCIVNDFMRYTECNDYTLSRPLITFITTKENADKLKYIEKEKFKLEYLSIDYKSIQYSLKTDKRTNKPNQYKFKTISKRFNNFLLKSQEQRDDNNNYFYYIPTELERVKITDKERVKIRGNYNKEKADFDEEEQKLNQAKEELKTAENELSLDPDNDGLQNYISDTRNQIKQLEAILEESSKKLRQFVIKNEYRFGSDYEYKRLLERFQFRVENKLNVKLNLEDWSLCVVFSPLWCDSEHIPKTEKGGLDLLKYLVTDSSEIKKSFNTTDKRGDIDNSMMSILEGALRQPKVSQLDILDEIGEINNFNTVFRAFKKFSNGGYWVKKIVKEKDVFKEKTEGPYSMSEAEVRVNILKNIISLENVEVAKMYDFKDLVCNNNLITIEGESDIEKYVEEENRYSPYPGAKLFCLVHGFADIVFFQKQTLTEKFRKFSDYAINSGMNYVSTFNYLIYYNPDSKTSVRKVEELKQLLRKREDYIEDEFLWLIDAIEGRKVKRGTEPDFKPFKILSVYQEEGKLTYQGLIELYKMIESFECSENRLEISYDNFKNAIGDGYINSYRDKDFNIKFELLLGVIQNEEDDKPKKFKITKDYNGEWEIGMHRFRKKLKDIDLISVKDIKDCKGYLNIKFKNLKDKTWEISKLNLISNDQIFNNEIVLMALTLFVCKSFGLKTIVLDNRLLPSECENNILFHYYHIYFIGIGNFSAFEEIGFMVDNYGDYKVIIENIKNMTIKDFVIEEKLRVKVPTNVEKITLENFCKDYIRGEECFTKNNLILLNQISAYVNELIKIDIFVDLDEISFEHLLNYISF